MTIESLEFEMPRRSVLFHTDTEMPDQTLLGYVGDPNSADPLNTEGESLIYNSPPGTWYADKGVSPYVMWVKVEAGGGGAWTLMDSVDAGEHDVDGGSFV